jgi:hypothetical protein
MKSRVINHIKRVSALCTDTLFYGFAGVALVHAAFFALYYVHQPLIESHAFRQTQTALTSYWILEEGWKIAYQTPVVGFPWAIPFEFPLYQSLVAGVVALTGAPLTATGRLLSFVSLVACAWPMYGLARRLELPRFIASIFATLLWSAPSYVFWGRSFMIETTALFFALASLPFATDLIRQRADWKAVVGFLVFSTLAILQKITTFLPVLGVLSVILVVSRIRHGGWSWSSLRGIVAVGALFAIPFLLGAVWTGFTDQLKEMNPLGAALTGAGLSTWNLGTLEQRLSPHTWYTVVLQRSLLWNIGAGVFGGVILLVGPVIAWRRGQKKVSVLALLGMALFLLPILAFTNLHVVHDYYQMACLAFLLAAVAVLVGGAFEGHPWQRLIAAALTGFLLAINIVVFFISYRRIAARSVGEVSVISQQAYAVGHFLKDNTPKGSGIAVFHQDWSPEMAFHAERKAMTVPEWSVLQDSVWRAPQQFLGDVPLSAIAVCPLTEAFPAQSDIDVFLSHNPGWRLVYREGCALLLRHPLRGDLSR